MITPYFQNPDYKPVSRLQIFSRFTDTSTISDDRGNLFLN